MLNKKKLTKIIHIELCRNYVVDAASRTLFRLAWWFLISIFNRINHRESPWRRQQLTSSISNEVDSTSTFAQGLPFSRVTVVIVINLLMFRNEKLLADASGSAVALPKAKKTGTTIVGVCFKDGVVLGADTRATEGMLL
jgi:hypothetical protein